MNVLCFIIAAIVFAVGVFKGRIGDLNLVYLGLFFIALGLAFSGGVVGWVKERVR